MESEANFTPQPEKPSILFHASRNRNITAFEPRAESNRDKNEGAKVFATLSRAMAGIFLVESNDSWVLSGVMDDTPYIIISDEQRFRELDRGGAVYSLPNDTFENDPEKGLGEFEWTSDKAVTPSEKEEIPSALDDMIANGVKVYFVDKKTFEDIDTASDHGRSIIEGLTPLSN